MCVIPLFLPLVPQVTGVFAIIVCGTLGTLAIHLAAPILLSPAEEGSDSEAGESTVVAEPGDGAEDQVGGWVGR